MNIDYDFYRTTAQGSRPADRATNSKENDMAKFYTVTGRTITAETTVEAISAAELVKTHEFVINGQHAVAFSTGGPYAQTTAVMVYAKAGTALIGARA